ncbi:MAG: hypothetical protein WCP97_06090 [bacterium]
MESLSGLGKLGLEGVVTKGVGEALRISGKLVENFGRIDNLRNGLSQAKNATANLLDGINLVSGSLFAVSGISGYWLAARLRNNFLGRVAIQSVTWGAAIGAAITGNMGLAIDLGVAAIGTTLGSRKQKESSGRVAQSKNVNPQIERRIERLGSVNIKS